MSQHRVAHRKLGRKTEHRIATLRNLATSLLEHERIETTLFKAKDLRPFAEKLISRARRDSVHARRIVGRDIQDRDVLKRLFDDIAPRFIDRPGGYTRILRAMPRRGDAAEMAIVELVVRPEKKAAEPSPDAKKGKAKKAPAADEEPKKKAPARSGRLGALRKKLAR